MVIFLIYVELPYLEKTAYLCYNSCLKHASKIPNQFSFFRKSNSGRIKTRILPLNPAHQGGFNGVKKYNP